jgi:hypothetical protein
MSALEHQVPLSQRKPYKRQDAKVRYAAAKQGFAVRRTRRNDQSAVWLLRVREWDPARGMAGRPGRRGGAQRMARPFSRA